MIAYHYSVVQCRDFAVPGERRNVALLAVCPALGRAWLARGQLKARAHLVGDDAAFVRVLLDLLLAEAEELAQEGSPGVVQGWLRSKALPSEQALVLANPALGVAEDVKAEVDRLARLYLGPPPRVVTSVAERTLNQAVKALRLGSVLRPREIDAGAAAWRYPFVAEHDATLVIVNAVSFQQTTPKGLLEAAFANAGRAQEVGFHHPRTRWLTVAEGPEGGQSGRAYERVQAILTDAGLNLVPPDRQAVTTGLLALGLASSRADAIRA